MKNIDLASNTDIEIDNMAQLTLPDLQISLAEKGFRGYVKVIGDKAYLRAEKFLTPNKPIREALENIRTILDLDKDFSLPAEDAEGCGNGRKENNVT